MIRSAAIGLAGLLIGLVIGACVAFWLVTQDRGEVSYEWQQMVKTPPVTCADFSGPEFVPGFWVQRWPHGIGIRVLSYDKESQHVHATLIGSFHERAFDMWSLKCE